MRYRIANSSSCWKNLDEDDKKFFLQAGCWYLIDILELILLFIFSRLEAVKSITKELPIFQIDDFEILEQWTDACDKIIKQTGCLIWIIAIVGILLGVMAAYLIVRGLIVTITSQFAQEHLPVYLVVLLGIFVMTIVLCYCIKVLIIPLIVSFIIVSVVNVFSSTSE